MDKAPSRAPGGDQAHRFPAVGAQPVQFWNGLPQLCEIRNGVLPVLHLCPLPSSGPAEEQDFDIHSDGSMLAPRARPLKGQRTRRRALSAVRSGVAGPPGSGGAFSSLTPAWPPTVSL